MTEKTKKRRMGWIVGGSIVAAAVIVYLAFIFPWPTGENFQGTIGGAKKAKRHHAEQMSQEDILLENAEVQNIL